MSTSKRIPELQSIEFKGHKSVQRYSQALRDLNRDVAHEAEFAAEELQAVLARQKGHPLLAGLDVRLRARKVAKRLRRSAELSAGAAVEAVKLYAEFRAQFTEVIKPKEKKDKGFDFNDYDGD
jgi:hypothetical protein